MELLLAVSIVASLLGPTGSAVPDEPELVEVVIEHDPAHVQIVPNGRGGTMKIVGELRTAVWVPADQVEAVTSNPELLQCSHTSYLSYPYLLFTGGKRYIRASAWQQVSKGCDLSVHWSLTLYRNCLVGLCTVKAKTGLVTPPGSKTTITATKVCKGTKATTYTASAPNLSPFNFSTKAGASCNVV